MNIALQPHRISVLIGAILVGAALCLAYLAGRHTGREQRKWQARAHRAIENGSMAKPSLRFDPASLEAAAARPRTALAPVSLPPANTPLSQIYDSLAARARAGDGEAAKRLFSDLHRCAGRASATRLFMMKNTPFAEKNLLDRLDRTDALCAAVSDAQIDARGEWLRDAALAGDAEAMVCYAMSPNDFGPKFLSSEWLDYVERWRGEAPMLAAQAFTAGRADAIPLLLDAVNARWGDADGFSMTTYAFGGLFDPDPTAAYAYARLYETVVPTSSAQRAHMQVQSALAGLSAAQVARAEAFVDEQAPRFAAEAGLRRNIVPCRDLLHAGLPYDL